MQDSVHYRLYRLKLKAAMVTSRPLTRGIAGASSIALGVAGFLVHYTTQFHGFTVDPPMIGGLFMFGVGGGLLGDICMQMRKSRLRHKTLN